MLDGPIVLQAALVACFLDAVCGYPQGIFARFGHPVTWGGWLISQLETRFNQPDASEIKARLLGTSSLLIVIVISGSLALVMQRMIMRLPGEVTQTLLLGICAAPLLAWRSLRSHVHAVHLAFQSGGLHAARESVAKIVGRDVALLDEGGVSRAAIESLAENFSDGVIAPLFWFLILGLPGLVAYKMINTADSMIGHLSPRYAAFGRASALTDDVVNAVPARLTSMLIALAGGSMSRCRRAWCTIMAGARDHRSFNAGWPEGAMAGVLDVALAGPRYYAGVRTSDSTLNPRGRKAMPADIVAAINVSRRGYALLTVLLGLLIFLILYQLPRGSDMDQSMPECFHQLQRTIPA